MRELVIGVDQFASHSGTVRVARLFQPGLSRELADPGVRIEFVGRHSMPRPQVLDGYLFMFLLLAMRGADRLRIEGPLSETAIRNAVQLQEAWHCWLPERYHLVDIVASEVVASTRGPEGRPARSIAAFSGGVDSTFSLLRHAPALVRTGSYGVDTALTVHGFDIPLSSEAAFSGLVERTAPLLDALGLERVIVRTDARRDDLQDWRHSHGAQIAGVLHQVSHEFDVGIIASGEPYDRMTTAWGSTPSTDHLLGGDDLRIVHDGAGFGRTEKVAAIASDAVAVRGLKVCWEGQPTAGNCGTCEKCVRTRLNFKVAGLADPDCFDTPFDLAMIPGLQPRTQIQLDELDMIAIYAASRGLRADWLDHLVQRLGEWKTMALPSQPARQ